MTKALRPSSLRALLIALAATLILASLGAATASAVNVNLRIEGQSATHFSGAVNTGPRSVPGGTATAGCAATTTANDFTDANTLTAIADAVGAGNMTTSGTAYGWGVLLCSVNGEISPDNLGGWYVRINQKDSTSTNGYVTATDKLSEGDSVVAYYAPSFGVYSASLELRAPGNAKPGEPVTAYVDSYNTSTDAKSNGSGVTVSGGGASSTTAADGSVSLTFPSAGRFLLTATKSGAVRGSAWITVDPAAVVTPVTPSKTDKQRRMEARRKCLRSYKWHRTSSKRYKKCVHRANRIGKKSTKK